MALCGLHVSVYAARARHIVCIFVMGLVKCMHALEHTGSMLELCKRNHARIVVKSNTCP